MVGWSALTTALAFLPAGVLVAASSVRMGPVLDRFGATRIIVLAFASLTAGYACFLRVGVVPDYPAVILPSVLLIGGAFALGFSSLNVAATSGVADREQGLASGILQSSFQVGGAIVLAVVTAVVDSGGANRVVSAQALSAYRPALEVITSIAVFGLVIALSGLIARAPRHDDAQITACGEEAEPEPVTARSR